MESYFPQKEGPSTSIHLPVRLLDSHWLLRVVVLKSYPTEPYGAHHWIGEVLGSESKILGGNQTKFFGYGIVNIEMFEKKIFQIMCHMMGCYHSSG